MIESHSAQTALVRYLIFKKNNILPTSGNSASRTEQASVPRFSNSASVGAVAKLMLESSLSYPSIAFSPHCGCSDTPPVWLPLVYSLGNRAMILLTETGLKGTYWPPPYARGIKLALIRSIMVFFTALKHFSHYNQTECDENDLK